MGFKDWFGKNMYVTTPQDQDPFFRPRRFSQPKEEVLKAVLETIGSLRDWRVEEQRENQGRIHASRSALFPPLGAGHQYLRGPGPGWGHEIGDDLPNPWWRQGRFWQEQTEFKGILEPHGRTLGGLEGLKLPSANRGVPAVWSGCGTP